MLELVVSWELMVSFVSFGKNLDLSSGMKYFSNLLNMGNIYVAGFHLENKDSVNIEHFKSQSFTSNKPTWLCFVGLLQCGGQHHEI